jgi:hypothetical protein
VNDMMPVTDDPASDAGEAASDAAEAVHSLNYATQPAEGWPGLNYPGDVYNVLGSLAVLAEQLPQTCEQLVGFLEREVEHDRVVAVAGQPFEGEPAAAVATAAHWLQQAGGLAEQLRLALQNAQVATAGLAHASGDED